MGTQLRDLQAHPSIVIGTPGRIKDHMKRGSLNLSGFTMLVLDEVDRMLDMGFVNDIRIIVSAMPTARQSFFFTATIDSKVSSLIRDFSRDPITISVKTGETTDMVEQAVISYVDKADRMDRLHDLLLKAPKALVFDDMQHSVERLSQELQARGFQADAIHGGKTQGQRQRALNKFKANEITVLVATDVAARGIDVSDITHVINFSTPKTYDDYVHRIGRTGRAGKTGFAYTFIEM
jgi:superfamily II DNA/RNA helicase